MTGRSKVSPQKRLVGRHGPGKKHATGSELKEQRHMRKLGRMPNAGTRAKLEKGRHEVRIMKAKRARR
jgi:hypothetical protein